jgi:XTP/dITP diphosphohydrolase
VSKLVLATANAGKLSELAALLAGLDVEVVAQGALGVASPAETGATFAENALIKARHATQTTGLAAVADDSGLEVDALDGAPGVHSARYAGPDASDRDNNRRLLEQLRGSPAPRTARYRCVLAYLADANAEPVLCAAAWEGAIALAPRGAGGFGYDPLFLVAGDRGQRTAAELAPAEKNRISHRGQALAQLRAVIAAGRRR